MSGMVRRLCGLVTLLGSVASAHAGGLDVVGGSPRAIGRAGAGTVGDDGGGALLVNPASMARRDTVRVSLGIAYVDDEAMWDPDHPEAPDVRDQASSRMLPLIAGVVGFGAWVIGAGVMTTTHGDSILRTPTDVSPGELGALFEYRYAGVSSSLRRDVVTVGAARRLGDHVAIGVSLAASRVTFYERRLIWAGFAGVVPVGDPRRDVDVSFDGKDRFVPAATAGILVAPPGSPFELAASVGWNADASIDAEVEATGTAGGPLVRTFSPRAHLELSQPLAVRAGVRYLGDSLAIEVGGDLWFAPRRARNLAWAVTGVDIVDPSTVEALLSRVPSRLSQRTHGALRGAVDVELISGFLWATAGYAFSVGATTADQLSPTLADLGGHTVALGVEGTSGGVTVTLGWARTFAVGRRGGGGQRHDNPFAAGDGPVPGGRYDGSADQLGVLLDLELGAPE